MNKIFEFTQQNLIQILGSAILMYTLLILFIRLFGKRSTSKFNSFDWIVTVSIGSLLASTVILKDVSFVEGAFSILVLMFLQFLVTKIAYHIKPFQNLVKTSPKLLFFNGEFIEENMKNERVLQEEILSAVRLQGLKSIEDVYAIVLETDSQISVLPNEDSNQIGFSLRDVKGLPKELKFKLQEKELK